MPETENIQITLENYDNSKTYFDFDNIIYDLDSEIDLLSSQADNYDYLVSLGSGILSELLDILIYGRVFSAKDNV